MRRFTGPILFIAGTALLALSYNPRQVGEYRLLYFLGGILCSAGAFLYERLRAPSETNRVLRNTLRKFREEKAAAVARRNTELGSHAHRLNALKHIQNHWLAFMLPVLKPPSATHTARWEELCDHVLGELAKAWRAQYYPKGKVLVRCTLYRAEKDRLIPLRRSSGGRQNDEPRTRWVADEGAAGDILLNGETVLVANVKKELQAAKDEARPATVAFHADRPSHKNIQALLCEPLFRSGTGLLGVLCVDASAPLPSMYEERFKLPDYPIIFIQAFVPPVIAVLEAKSE